MKGLGIPKSSVLRRGREIEASGTVRVAMGNKVSQEQGDTGRG
jgi:hypothetical protein